MLSDVPIQTDVVGGQVEMMIQYIRRPRLLMQSVPTNCLELSLILAIVFRVVYVHRRNMPSPHLDRLVEQVDMMIQNIRRPRLLSLPTICFHVSL